LREFIVAPHFYAGPPIECRTSVTAVQCRCLITDKMFSITARMLMADHEEVEVLLQFGIPLFKIQSRNDGVRYPWWTNLGG
jgi:hypothetical protein